MGRCKVFLGRCDSLQYVEKSFGNDDHYSGSVSLRK